MKEKLVFGVGVTDIPVKLNGKPERKHKNEIDIRVFNALMNYQVEVTD